MAKTVRDIGTLAFRKLGILRAGGEMKAADAQEALESLSSYYQECISAGAFGRVRDVPVSSAYTGDAGKNQHINILTEDTVDIELPDTLPACYWAYWVPCRDYGWGLNVPLGDGTGDNVPPDKSVVRITSKYDENRATYLYDGTIQRWLRIDNLTLDSEAPLSARNPDGLASLLAVRLADQFGSDLLSPLTLNAANRFKMAMVTTYGAGDNCGYEERCC